MASEEHPYIAGKEIIESLHLELYEPKEVIKGDVREFAESVIQKLNQKYEKYIPSTELNLIRANIDGIEKRIFLLKPDDYDNFLKAWLPDHEVKFTDNDDINNIGVYIDVGDLIVIKDPEQIAQVYLDKIKGKKLLDLLSYCNEINKPALEVIKDSIFRLALIHEITHSSQIYLDLLIKQHNLNLNLGIFKELGASFLELDLAKEFNIMLIAPMGIIKKAEIFEKLSLSLGVEKVYYVFFGKVNRGIKNPLIQFALDIRSVQDYLNKITSELKDAFKNEALADKL